MTVWEATEVEFSDILDRAEREGPQLVERSRRRFVVVPEELWASGVASESVKGTETMSGKALWDALRCPPEDGVDTEFPRLDWQQREVEF